ncbi:hypothetical protein ACFLWG_02310 [Chloroflexota bacterium]
MKKPIDGKESNRLTDKEKHIIFDVIKNGGDQARARNTLTRKGFPDYCQATIARIYHIGRQLIGKYTDAQVLRKEEAEVFAGNVGYNVTAATVINLHRIYQLWEKDKQNKLEAERKSPVSIRESDIIEGSTTVTINTKDYPQYIVERSLTDVVLYGPFSIKLRANKVSIVNITVWISDQEVPYRLMLFERNPSEYSGDWSPMDLLQIEPVTQRIYIFSKWFPFPYVDRNNSQTLHGGIELHRKTMHFDLKNDQLRAYHEESVNFNITLRYVIALLGSTIENT